MKKSDDRSWSILYSMNSVNNLDHYLDARKNNPNFPIYLLLYALAETCFTYYPSRFCSQISIETLDILLILRQCSLSPL